MNPIRIQLIPSKYCTLKIFFLYLATSPNSIVFTEAILCELWGYCNFCHSWDIHCFHPNRGACVSITNFICLVLLKIFHLLNIYLYNCSYLGGLTFLMYKLPLMECLMFGALISATDPVTVLSIFQVPSFSFLHLILEPVLLAIFVLSQFYSIAV